MFIDAHTHGMHAERDEEGHLQPPVMPSWRPDVHGSPDALIKKHRENGVEKILALDPPEMVFDLQKTFGDFIIPIPMIDPDATTPEDLGDLFARGAAGIKFIAPTRSYGDNCYFPLYEAIRDAGSVAIFHTGFLSHGICDPGGILGRSEYVDITNMRPAALDRIARAFPDLKMVLAHFGNPWWEEAWKIMSSNKNIYAELSGGTAIHRSMDMWRNMFAPNGHLHTASVEKLCFASDTWYSVAGQFDYMEYIEFHERLFDVLDLSAELRARISRENILSLIKQGTPGTNII